MRSTRLRPTLAGLVGLTLWAGIAGAQPVATSLADLQGLASGKTHVTVTDANGRELRGRVTDVSESRLSLRIGREVRRFDAADVRLVRARTEDGLGNGALIGAAVGGGLSSLMFLDNECRDDPACYTALAVYTGLGALAGLGIDALIHRTVVVYAAPPRPPRVAMIPLLANGRKGVRLVIGF